MPNIKNYILAHKTTVILIVTILVIGILGWIGVQKFLVNPNQEVEEIDLVFDPEGPFAMLYPRKDGNALILNLQRTSSYDAISYELAYTSAPDETVMAGSTIKEDIDNPTGGVIDRGVKGDIDTKEKKGEYEQEILFGTCSKNVCKYDKGVENGTLTLLIKKGNKIYRMVTLWHMQKPDVALGNLTSGDNHLVYKVEGDRQALSNSGFTIINDLTGAPKLPAGKIVLGKVYSLNVPVAKHLDKGNISIELAETPGADAKIFRFNNSNSTWEQLDTKADGSTLQALTDGAGIFAVLTSK